MYSVLWQADAKPCGSDTVHRSGPGDSHWEAGIGTAYPLEPVKGYGRICGSGCASWFKVGEAVIKPFYLLLRSIPSIAWIPLAILWLGIGERSKYFIIFITAVMIIMTNVMDGVKAVDPDLLGAARMLGTKENQLFIHIVLPSAVPQIFNGLQVALGSAWAAVLAAEMVRSSEGVGWIILAGQSSMNMVQIFAGIVVIGLIGLFLASVMRFAESKLCAWNVRGK